MQLDALLFGVEPSTAFPETQKWIVPEWLCVQVVAHAPPWLVLQVHDASSMALWPHERYEIRRFFLVGANDLVTWRRELGAGCHNERRSAVMMSGT